MTRAARAVALLALLAAAPVPDGYRMDDYRAPVPDTVPGAAVIYAAALADMLKAGTAIAIDVLPAPRRPPDARPGTPWLPPQHLGLPGSLWWPDVGRGALPPELEDSFRTKLTALAAVHPQATLVFYCLDQCWMSWNAAKRAATYGIRAGWFPEGADGWQREGRPTELTQPDSP